MWSSQRSTVATTDSPPYLEPCYTYPAPFTAYLDTLNSVQEARNKKLHWMQHIAHSLLPTTLYFYLSNFWFPLRHGQGIAATKLVYNERCVLISTDYKIWNNLSRSAICNSVVLYYLNFVQVKHVVLQFSSNLPSPAVTLGYTGTIKCSDPYVRYNDDVTGIGLPIFNFALYELTSIFQTLPFRLFTAQVASETMEVQGASSRIPFRAASTPPASTPHLHIAPPSYIPSTHTSQDGYPESPMGLRPHASLQKPYVFILGQPRTRRRLFRVFRSPKRLFLVVFLGVLALLGKGIVILRNGNTDIVGWRVEFRQILARKRQG